MELITIALVVSTLVSVAAGVAQVVQSEQQFEADTSAIQEKKRIETERLNLEAAERELRRKNELAALRRQARVNRAVIANRNAAQNVRFTTPTNAALNAVRKNLAREFEFSDQTAALASQGDDITLRQLDLEARAATSRANAALFSGVLTGIGSIAKGGKTAVDNDLFGKLGGGNNTGTSELAQEAFVS